MDLESTRTQSDMLSARPVGGAERVMGVQQPCRGCVASERGGSSTGPSALGTVGPRAAKAVDNAPLFCIFTHTAALFPLAPAVVRSFRGSYAANLSNRRPPQRPPCHCCRRFNFRAPAASSSAYRLVESLSDSKHQQRIRSMACGRSTVAGRHRRTE